MGETWSQHAPSVEQPLAAVGDALYRSWSALAAWTTVTQEYNPDQVANSVRKLQGTLKSLSTKLDSMHAQARGYAQKARELYRAHNREAAVHQLRLQKMYDAEARKLESLKFNIESKILHMESVGVIMETVATIKDTSEHFQLVHRNVDIQQLESTIEDMLEQQDTSQDIQTILNQTAPAQFDDDELLQELETMTDHDNDADDAAVLANTMPVAPVGPIQSPKPRSPSPVAVVGAGGGGARAVTS